jgi:prevent-host-death family protein
VIAEEVVSLDIAPQIDRTMAPVAPRVTRCYADWVAKTISQRELRNDSAAVMDAVERGETIVVTRNGNPIAELRPLRRGTFVPTAELMQACRGLPRMNLTQLRSEADELFGEQDLVDG